MVSTGQETVKEAAVPARSVRDDTTSFVLGGSGGLRRRDQGAIGTWIGIGVVLVLVAIPLRGLYRFTGGTMEEGFMLYFPERMAKGDVPNVDFLHLYGPGSLHVLRWWYEIFGFSLRAERTFGLLQHVGIIFGLFTLARAWGRAAATCVASLAVFYVLTPVALTAMAWNGGLALTLWSAVFALRRDPHRRTASGAALADRRRARRAGPRLPPRPGDRDRSGSRPAPLAAAGVTPTGSHRARRRPAPDVDPRRAGRSARAAVRGMFVDPVFHLRAGRELPRPPSWNRLDGALQGVAEEIPPWWRLPHLAASNALFLWFFVMVLGTLGLLAFAVCAPAGG